MFARSELTAVVKDEETPLPLPFLIHKANPSPRQASSGSSAWQVSHTWVMFRASVWTREQRGWSLKQKEFPMLIEA